ncbi:hypothetical protein CLV62_14128 [Dysgonomonas alginatilytica]|uniref:Uncharacterized protein n=1 Tax=Dysgonomonas alginatilytica TaxID=1605892 RepID=A0A2V3PJZ0_9BACT|nr:hypothetical protein [Dysgonomonas alginatilytica]PXV58917.1 hypothetical protein CLV62_14128 [Dysgonomonas alginatilytica]
MKNIYILILFNILSPFSLIYAQIGVFTEIPKALFHIDGKGDNIITNDWLSAESGGHLKIALGTLPDTGTGAQLELGSTQSAFLPNRVALTSITDNVTVPSPVAGMIVYNTATTTGSNMVMPGLYLHDGVKWSFLYNSGFSNMFLTYRDLQASVTTITASAIEPEKTILMNFGGPIDIPETGGYNFSFRMYGRTSNTTNNVLVGIYYLWCMTYNSLTNVYTPKDVVELDLPVYSTGVPITATATLGANFIAGDKVVFKISHLPTGDEVNVRWTLQGNPGLNANKTSVIYWKNY